MNCKCKAASCGRCHKCSKCSCKCLRMPNPKRTSTAKTLQAMTETCEIINERQETPNPKRRPPGFNTWSRGRQSLVFLNGSVLPNPITNTPADSNDSYAELQKRFKSLTTRLEVSEDKIKILKAESKIQKARIEKLEVFEKGFLKIIKMESIQKDFSLNRKYLRATLGGSLERRAYKSLHEQLKDESGTIIHRRCYQEGHQNWEKMVQEPTLVVNVMRSCYKDKEECYNFV
eukprot:Pgem_evm1s3598